MGLIYFGIVSVVNILAHFHARHAFRQHPPDQGHHIMHLAFEHGDQTAAMPELRIGSVEAEEVGIAGNYRPQIGSGIISIPIIMQLAATSADNLHGCEQIDDVEPGRPDQNIGLVDCAVIGDDAVWARFDDGAGDEFHIVARQSPEPAIIEQHTLTERGVIRQSLGQQMLRVAQLVLDIVGQSLAMGIVDGVDRTAIAVPGRILSQRIIKLVVKRPAQPQPVPQAVQRNLAQQAAERFRDILGEFGKRRSPLRRALDDRQRGHLSRYCRCHLHRARAIADEHNVAPGQIDSRIGIMSGVDTWPLEGGKTRHIGNPWLVECSDTADQDIGPQRFNFAGCSDRFDFPLITGFIKTGLVHFHAKANVPANVVIIGDTVEISVNFAAARKKP